MIIVLLHIFYSIYRIIISSLSRLVVLRILQISRLFPLPFCSLTSLKLFQIYFSSSVGLLVVLCTGLDLVGLRLVYLLYCIVPICIPSIDCLFLIGQSAPFLVCLLILLSYFVSFWLIDFLPFGTIAHYFISFLALLVLHTILSTSFPWLCL